MVEEVLKILETNDIQGLILSGYASQSFAEYLFMTIRDGVDAKPWLAELSGRITGAANFDRQRKTSINIAFTYKGFVASACRRKL